jgi:hypothetical protein
MRPGTRALFFLSPRDRKYWVGGRPTYDLVGGSENYYVASEQWRPNSDPVLTPDELLVFSDALPTFEATAPPDTTYPELEPLRRWMREHPDLARREPARSRIPVTMLMAEQERVRRTATPLAGTYRFDVVLRDSASTTIFARTDPRPYFAVFVGEDRVSSPGPDSPVVRSQGFEIASKVATRPDLLPVQHSRYDDRTVDFGSFGVVERPELANADSTVWRGRVHVLSARLAGDSALARRIRAASEQLQRSYRADGVNATGRFIRYADGRVRFESDPPAEGPLLLSIRGERISPTTLIEP